MRFGNVLGSSGLGDPDLPPPDRARRPGHRDEPGDDALLHDDPGGVVARRPGRRDGRPRPGLRARHGRAGEDPRPRAADDPPLRHATRRRSRSSSPARAPARRCTRCSGTRARRSARPRTRRSCAPPGRRSTPDWLEEELAELERLVEEGDTLGVVAKLRPMVAEPQRTGARSGARRHVALTSRFGYPPPGCRYGGSVDPLDGLNPEQRRAAEAVRGPVCILAGAGSGKTTTITRRIAQQVAAGAFAPTQIMAVTFTDKAAGELTTPARGARRRRRARRARSTRRRCASCVTSRPTRSGGSCRRRRSLLRQIANRCRRRTSSGPPATSRPRSNGRRTAASRRSATRDRRHEPPIPLDLMQRVYREYEQRKAAEGLDRLRGPARARGAALRGRRRARATRSGPSTARSRSTSTRT